MASITIHTDGERFIETKKKAAANIAILVEDGRYSATDYQLDLAGKTRTSFNKSLSFNMAQFEAEVNTIGVQAQALLTMDTKPTLNDTVTLGLNVLTFKAGNTTDQATGIWSLPTKPTDGDTFTLGTHVYTMVTSSYNRLVNKVAIGATVAESQANILAAVHGTDGVNTANAFVTLGAWAGNATLVTAILGGTSGNAIALAETFTAVGNVFDAAFLGNSTTGAQLASGQVGIGATLAESQANLSAAIMRTDIVNAAVAHICTIGDWSAGDTAILTVIASGVAGNALESTETFTALTNIIDDDTFGTQRAGVDEVLALTTKRFDQGDRIHEIRKDLNANFALIDAIVNP